MPPQRTEQELFVLLSVYLVSSFYVPFKVKYYEIAESFSHLVDFADKFAYRIAACVIGYTHLDKISCLWLFTVTGEEYTAVNLGASA